MGTGQAYGAEPCFARWSGGVAERQRRTRVGSWRSDGAGENDGHGIGLEVLNILQRGIVDGGPRSIRRRLGDTVQLCRVEKRLMASAPSPVPWYSPATDAVVADKPGRQGKTHVQIFQAEGDLQIAYSWPDAIRAFSHGSLVNDVQMLLHKSSKMARRHHVCFMGRDFSFTLGRKLPGRVQADGQAEYLHVEFGVLGCGD